MNAHMNGITNRIIIDFYSQPLSGALGRNGSARSSDGKLSMGIRADCEAAPFSSRRVL